MEGIKIKELALFEDQRGWLGEIHRRDDTGYEPAMSYLSLTKPGLVRGPHEHVEQTDLFCFIGKFRLYLWDNREASSTFQEARVIDTSGVPTIAVVPPGIVHAYKNMESSDALVLNMPDRLYKGEGRVDPVDEVRYEDDPDSLYKIDD